MSKVITWEIQYFFQCFIWGVWMMMLYDMLRIFRLVIYHKSLWMAIEDFIYWIYCAIGMFLLMYMWNDGNIRWFSIVGSGLGMLLYNMLVSKYVVAVIGRVIYRILKIIFAPLNYIVKKTRNGTNFLEKKMKFLGLRLIKMLKKLCKSVNIIDKKQNGKKSEKLR